MAAKNASKSLPKLQAKITPKIREQWKQLSLGTRLSKTALCEFLTSIGYTELDAESFASGDIENILVRESKFEGTEPTCHNCGKILKGRDRDHSTCRDCASPKGKLSDLDIAIRATGDTPTRISEWRSIQYHLQKRYGKNLSDEELWEQFVRFLEFEKNLARSEFLNWPLSSVIPSFENDTWPQTATGGRGRRKPRKPRKRRVRLPDNEKKKRKQIAEGYKVSGMTYEEYAKHRGDCSEKDVKRAVDWFRKQ